MPWMMSLRPFNGVLDLMIGAGLARSPEPRGTILPPERSVAARTALGLLFGLAVISTLLIGLYFIFVLAFPSECYETKPEQYSEQCREAGRWGLVELGALGLFFIVGLAQAAWGRQYRYFFRAMLVGTVLTAGVVAVGRLIFD